MAGKTPGVRIGRKREPDLRQPRRHQRRERAIADLVNGREPHQHFVADLIQRPGDPLDGVGGVSISAVAASCRFDTARGGEQRQRHAQSARSVSPAVMVSVMVRIGGANDRQIETYQPATVAG